MKTNLVLFAALRGIYWDQLEGNEGDGLREGKGCEGRQKKKGMRIF